jgi:hypothetical protein
MTDASRRDQDWEGCTANSVQSSAQTGSVQQCAPAECRVRALEINLHALQAIKFPDMRL